MEIQDDFVKKLARTGGLAIFSGLPGNAQTILEGVRAIRPDNLSASIGLAIARVNANRLDDAIVILRDWVLKVEPENLTAKCFLGLALKHSGQNRDGDRLLREVIEKADGKNVNDRMLARDLLSASEAVTRSTV